MNTLRTHMDANELDLLLEALGSPEIETRLSALETYQNVVDTRAVEPLVELLNHWNERVSLEAIKALGNQRDESTVPFLADKLHDYRTSMRIGAIRALCEIGSVSASEALSVVLQDEEESVRVFGVTSLGRIKNATLLPFLCKALKDSSQKVRQQVIYAMRFAGDEAVPILEEILYVAEEKDRSSVVQTLVVINTDLSIALLTAFYPYAPQDLRLTVMRALEAISSELKFKTIKLLAMALLDKEYGISSRARRCLSSLYWNQRDADSTTHRGSDLGLPRAVLATRQLTVPEKIEVLEQLHRAPRFLFFRSICDVSSVKRLCRKVLNEQNAEVRSGATDVLTWLELLRRSKRRLKENSEYGK